MITIIAGPCSAETREQTLSTAKELSQAGIKIFRAGVWKPRTRPGGFEGAGIEALEWLQEAKETYDLRIAVELNAPENVEHLLAHKIDTVWIGARTTVSPFAMDELGSALSATDLEVYVKNPICPDLDLWIGAIERLRQAGVKNVKAIHRGFMTHYTDIYRNEPVWSIAQGLKRQMPNLQVLCDPSHIAGKWEYVQQLCYMALQLGFDGLFVESHISPYDAWTDSRQQLSTQQMGELLADLRQNLPYQFL
ncbi:MAG: hypothetical protein R3Y19_07170 [Rikenellaceae bacterium]